MSNPQFGGRGRTPPPAQPVLPGPEGPPVNPRAIMRLAAEFRLLADVKITSGTAESGLASYELHGKGPDVLACFIEARRRLLAARSDHAKPEFFRLDAREDGDGTRCLFVVFAQVATTRGQ